MNIECYLSNLPFLVNHNLIDFDLFVLYCFFRLKPGGLDFMSEDKLYALETAPILELFVVYLYKSDTLLMWQSNELFLTWWL